MRVLWISCAALLVDQAAKWGIRETMTEGEAIPVLWTLVRFTYIHNPGGVFGLSLGGRYLHLVLAAAALAAVCFMFARMRSGGPLADIGLSLLLGGALGNLVDRILYGEVIDFLDVGIGLYRWWIFNVADACVTVGVGLCLWSQALCDIVHQSRFHVISALYTTPGNDRDLRPESSPEVP